MKKFKIYISKSLNPSFNLSLEEYFIKNAQEDEIYFFLWQNDSTVVIGRNQNPYKECNIKKMNEDNIKLIRRKSGGGAVYHDIGNLNFTFITSKKDYSLDNNMNIILNALLDYNIKGSFTGRNDLVVANRKFSGNAFTSHKNINCHHGTLLVKADINKLSQYLNPSKIKLKSKGVDSVSSRVVNLFDLSSLINIENLQYSLIKSFNSYYNINNSVELINEDEVSLKEELKTYMDKYDSFEWNYSQSPKYSISLEKKYTWGIIELNFNICDGKIDTCKVFTDSIILDRFIELENNLSQQVFNTSNIINSIDKIIDSKDIKKDMKSLVYSNLS